MNKPTKLLSALALSLLLVPSVASADLTKEYLENREHRAYHVFRPDTWRIIRAAEKAEKDGKVDEALDLFRQAFMTEQTVHVEAEYGLALLRAKKYLQAAQHLLPAQHMSATTIGFLQYPHKLIQEAVYEATREVGVISVECNQPYTTINVGAAMTLDWPFERDVAVEPGEVEVTATLAGYYRNFQKVTVKKGETKVVRIGMVSMRGETVIMGMPANVNVSVNDGRAPGTPETNPTWPMKVFIGSGIGMALGAVGLGIGLDMSANAKTDDDASAGRAMTISGIVLGGISLGGIIIAAGGLASRPAPVAPPPQILITPTVGGGPNERRGGVGIEGTF